jgi:hypothetical protein
MLVERSTWQMLSTTTLPVNTYKENIILQPHRPSNTLACFNEADIILSVFRKC